MSQEEMSQAANSNPKGDIGSIPLVIPEGIRYNCQACGRCCSGWAVGLTESDWQKVKDVDWSSLHPELKDKELFVHREEEFEKGLSLYPHFTKARPDGRCSFLVDGLCFMHSHLGEDSKPGVCKLLPYTYVPTPSGIFVGVTYNSMASVRNIGELLSNQVPMLEQTWRRVVDQQMNMGKASELEAQQATSVTVENMSAIRFQVNLMAGIPLTWDEYLTIENKLLEIAQDKSQNSIFAILLSMSDVLAESVKIANSPDKDWTKLSSFKPCIERWYKDEPGFFEGLVFNLLCYRNFVWPHIRKEFSERWAVTSKSPLHEPKVINTAMSTVLTGNMNLPDLGKVNINKAKKYKVDALDHTVDEFYRRFLFLKIFSKTYCGPALSGLSVISGYNNLVASVLTSLIYAKAVAMSKKGHHVDMDSLYEAHFLTDKESVSLSQLPQESASFFDTGFGSVRLFSRLIGQVASTTGGK